MSVSRRRSRMCVRAAGPRYGTSVPIRAAVRVIPGGHVAGSRTCRRAEPRGELRPSRGSRESVSDAGTDVAHDGVDLPAEEDHGGDHDDRDESQDESVLGQALSLLVGADGRRQLGDESCHVVQVPPFPRCPSRDGDHECASGQPALDMGRRYRSVQPSGSSLVATSPAPGHAEGRSPGGSSALLEVRGSRCQMLVPTLLMMVLICPPRKITAAITTIAMRARMRAYSARPCPSSSERTAADSLVMRAAMSFRYLLSLDVRLATAITNVRQGSRPSIWDVGTDPCSRQGHPWWPRRRLPDMQKGGAPGGAPPF